MRQVKINLCCACSVWILLDQLVGLTCSVRVGGAPLIEGLLGMILYPLTEPEAVCLWTDSGEGPAWMSQPLPPMLQPLLKTVNCENVNDANEVTLLRPVDNMQRIL